LRAYSKIFVIALYEGPGLFEVKILGSAPAKYISVFIAREAETAGLDY